MSGPRSHQYPVITSAVAAANRYPDCGESGPWGGASMTEAQWLACEDGWLMADQLQADERQSKWELLAAACWRLYPRDAGDDPYFKAVIAINEAAADGLPMPGTEWDDD